MLRDAGAASLKAGKADATLADAAQIARILESASGAASDDATLAAAASVLEGRSQAHVAAVVAQLRAAAAIEAVMEAPGRLPARSTRPRCSAPPRPPRPRLFSSDVFFLLLRG